MRIPIGLVITCSAAVAIVVGCDRREQSGGATASPATVTAVVPAGFVLNKAPEGAKDVAAVRSGGVKDGDELVVRGVVGGSVQPFVGGRAVVQIIDPSIPTCDKMPGEEGCKTPWDACCNKSDITARSATVEVVDAGGNPLKGTLQGVGGIKPLSEVIVRGKARTEGGKSLVVDASGIYVKP